MLLFSHLNGFSQATDSTTFKNFLTVTFGNKYYNIKQVGNNNAINFFNYFDKTVINNQQLGIQFRKALKKRNALTLSFLLLSDLNPANVQLAYSKLVRSNIGYFISLKNNQFYLHDYPILNNEEAFKNFEDIDINLRYGYIDSPSLNAGPVYYYSNKRLQIESKINVGLGCFVNFKEGSTFQKNNSFERMNVIVKNKLSPFLSIMPDLNLIFFPITTKKQKIGIIANSNLYYSKKLLNYQTIVNRWTNDNLSTIEYEGPKNRFLNYEINLGLIWQRK